MASSLSSNTATAGGMATTCITLVVAFVVLSLLFGTLHSTLPLFSSFVLPASSSSSSAFSIACNVSLPPLKIYMYVLPRRFNLGMLDHHPDLNRTSPSAANLPRWSYNVGLGRQHSVEYWMMASLLLSDAAAANATAEEEMEAVRVLDLPPCPPSPALLSLSRPPSPFLSCHLSPANYDSTLMAECFEKTPLSTEGPFVKCALFCIDRPDLSRSPANG